MKLLILIFECVTLLSLFQQKCTSGARILGFLAAASRSHFIVEEPVMRELAKRGHEVTVVTSFAQDTGDALENYRYIHIPDYLNSSFLLSFASDALQSGDKTSSITKIFGVVNDLVGYSLNLLRHPKFLPLKNESFDLLVVGWFMNEYVLGLFAHFNCPAVVISPNVNFYPFRKLSGNPSSVSTIPSLIMGVSSKMTFLDRTLNLEFPPNKYPPYQEVVRNVSLVLVAQHFSGQVSEPLLPNVIEVEGMHIKREPSPTEIQEFLDSASNGAIFFSLGSNVKSSDLSPDQISILLNKFQSLKQKVLWKFETELPHLPDNVKIGKWLPQDDILAHPNVKLFISHCGKGGITEAYYHGVPILAIPVFGDQFANADNIVNEGWAVDLPLSDMNGDTFSRVLDEALNNSTYAHAARSLSNLNRDRPEHPLDKAAFWIEYVLRHDGAKHMQSPAVHLNLLQYYSVDVFAFILVVVLVAIRVIRILFRVFLMKVFGVSGKRKVKKIVFFLVVLFCFFLEIRFYNFIV